MAMNSYTINNGKWRKISNAGESGSAWLKSTDEDGTVTILIAHTDETLTLVDGEITWAAAEPYLNISVGYLLPSQGISDTLERDNSNDIYYATKIDLGSPAEIISDFVVPG
jgi:hypothetical protein